ncbi:MAG: ATP-binding protein [Gemmatimonadota bacterium]
MALPRRNRPSARRTPAPGRPKHRLSEFARFFRRDARPAHGDSTGLGLAIAKAAAEAHGGQLEFVGNDPGAVFRLELPAQLTHS